MSELAAIVKVAWEDGLGPDDRKRLAAALVAPDPSDPALPELTLFTAFYDLLADIRADVPPAPPGAAARVVQLAASLEAARLARDVRALDTLIDELAAALAALTPAHPHAESARAWADLALGDVALAIDDLPTARRRYEAVAESGRPVALRITALLKIAHSALRKLNVDAARKSARRALTIAEHAQRYEHSTRARLTLAMLDYLGGDQASVRKLLAPHAKTSALARILLASTERAGRAMPVFAEGLRVATEEGDVMSYMLLVMVGARRYAAIDRRAEGLITLSAGIAHLTPVAPQLAGVLQQEREDWRKTWGSDEFVRVEADAVQMLENERVS